MEIEDTLFTLTIRADENADDCLADAADRYVAEFPALRGWDLEPRWADETRESVTLTIPRWHAVEID